jgi:GDP-L-fucose synthase
MPAITWRREALQVLKPEQAPQGSNPFSLSRTTRIFVAGHRGLVGSAILRRLERDGFNNIITRTSRELDLRNQMAVKQFFESTRPQVVILAAAKVGGILANSESPADFLYDNLAISTNCIHAAHQTGVLKLLNLGSSCIYPKRAPQPLKEEYLLTGPLEATNRAYAIAKIAAIELCDSYRTQYGDNFISAMPTNLYGPHDNFDLQTSHVLPALLRKSHEAKEAGHDHVTIWGTGTPRREFLYIEDLADACVFLLENVSRPGPINVGTGSDVSIAELADTVADIVGYEGGYIFDSSKPDGVSRKLLDVALLSGMGWRATTELRVGIQRTYEWYRENASSVRGA